MPQRKKPVFRCLLLALVLAGAPWLATRALAAEAPMQQRTLHVTHIAARDLLTSLRTIAYVEDLKAVDDHTIVVTDKAEQLDLAEAVTEMADKSDATADERLDVSDGTVILCVALQNASSVDVMRALMNRLHIARQATLGEKRLFLRDTDEKITAALKVISDLDSPASH